MNRQWKLDEIQGCILVVVSIWGGYSLATDIRNSDSKSKWNCKVIKYYTLLWLVGIEYLKIILAANISFEWSWKNIMNDQYARIWSEAVVAYFNSFTWRDFKLFKISVNQPEIRTSYLWINV
jgi:hypothetical protein